jgi:hypothetical protein
MAEALAISDQLRNVRHHLGFVEAQIACGKTPRQIKERKDHRVRTEADIVPLLPLQRKT